MSADLRTALGHMTKNADVADHPRELEKIRRVHPHSIQIVADRYVRPIDEYNCFAFALQLPDLSALHPLWLGAVNTNFIERLISEQLLNEDPSGAIAIYFTPRPMHAGRRVGDRVVSKWGSGYLYEHLPLEVPLAYGDDVRFMRSASAAALEEEFAKHLRTPQRYFF